MKFQIVNNGVQTELEYGQLNISSDETVGFRPFQLMIASIVSCSGMVFKNILDKQRIDVNELIIETEVKRNPDEANRIEHIALNFIISGNNLDQKRLEKNLIIARKNCAMIRSVEESIHIEESIQIMN